MQPTAKQPALRCAGGVFPCKRAPMRFLFVTSPRPNILGYCRECWLIYRYNWAEGQSKAFWRPGEYRSKRWYDTHERPAGRRLVVKGVW